METNLVVCLLIVILERILEKYDGAVWSGLIWISIGDSAGLLGWTGGFSRSAQLHGAG
jgi:hypothetical protein